MFTNTMLAEEVIKQQFLVVERLEKTLSQVKEHVSEEEYREYRLQIGKVIFEIWENIINPLFEQHPTLDRENLTAQVANAGV